MKGKKFKKLTSLAVTTAMAVTMMTSVVSADVTYTPVGGDDTSISFEKYLILPKEANVPTVSFDFDIEGGDAVEGSDSTLAVYSGEDSNKVVGSPSIDTVDFSNSDTTVYDTKQGDDTVTLASDQKYDVQVVPIKFSGVSFKEPGVYRYTISETNTIMPGLTCDSTQKTLDVYVEEAGSNTLTIAGTVLYDSVVTDAPAKDGTGITGKVTGFTNTYDAHDLTIAKEVAGNQASRDEYFQFRVEISNAAPNSTYTVDLTDADATTSVNGINTTALTNSDSFTTDSVGEAVYTCWLQGGQSVVIKGLSDSATYTVSEDADTVAKEGYTVSIEKNGDTDVTVSGVEASDTSTGIKDDTDITYTNTKNGVIPTGIILSVAGLLVVGIIAVIGFVFFGIRSKKRYDED